MIFNAGKRFEFNAIVSFMISCENQEKIDCYWNNLIADGGVEGNCGWCKDKFGLSWQIVPVILSELMNDSEKSERVLQAFLRIKKLRLIS